MDQRSTWGTVAELACQQVANTKLRHSRRDLCEMTEDQLVDELVWCEQVCHWVGLDRWGLIAIDGRRRAIEQRLTLRIWEKA